MDQVVQEGVNKNNCFMSFFVCWLQKSWVYRLIQGVYVHTWALKLRGHFNVDKKLSWLNFAHIIYFESLITFHQQKYNIPVQYCNTHCNITAIL